MTRDDIIRMAREAGLLTEVEAWVTPHQEAMERFAALVAAAERNKCRYPDCVDNGPEGKCTRWLVGECEGPKIGGEA